MKRLLAIALIGFACLDPAGAADSPVKSTPILTTTKTAIGQPIALPSKDAQVVVTMLEIAPGTKLPRHKHPSQRYGYVLQGELTVEYEGGQRQVFHAGDFIVEALGVWHFGTNTGPVPVKLLVIDQVEAGKSNTILAN
ncbi:MAG TPA: cupin domain-containing protein [Dongiaceae bacterium]